MTTAEVLLWKNIKGKQIEGAKFRRQFSIGIYVLDFYCPEFKICIELDGNDHFTEEGIIKDEKRAEYLGNSGIRILRFENKAVFKFTQSVLDAIAEEVRKSENYVSPLCPQIR